MDTLFTFRLPVIGFGLTLVFGFWVSRLGKPYHGLLFNVHKLIALASIILMGRQVSQAPQSMLSQTGWIAGLVLASLAVLALFASGAMMSTNKLDYSQMRLVHRISPVLLALGAGWAMVYIGGGS